MAIIESTQRDRAVWSFQAVRSPIQVVADLKAIWAELQRRRCYRRDLNRLLSVGPYMIEDIGLPIKEAHRETAKSFWRA